MRRLVLAAALAAAVLPVTASHADAPTCVEPYVETPIGDFDGNDVCLPTSGSVDCRNLVLSAWQVDTGLIVVYCIPVLK